MFARTMVILVLLVGPVLAANQPFGKKIIPGVRTVELATDLPGYAFFRVREEPSEVFLATRVELVPKVKQVIPGDLYVVPESAAKAMPDVQILGRSLAHEQIPGAHRVPPIFAEEVDENDPRTEMQVRILIQRVDKDAGLIYDRSSNDPNDPHNLVEQPGIQKGEPDELDEKPKSGSSLTLILGVFLVVVIVAGVAVAITRGQRETE